ncbi:DNA methylase [Brachyspira pilosicoli]|uniref:site-specific DNA-methyltransferase (cytosine-N(4)-specific) n=1 Tax=Brachyspira pilosicoli TaxID=52584 RepID=A0AAJ6KDL3_BRAPL|nr:DNA methylase [Brachyspira pilosicoli]WIH90007.1 DNA methylase [Brachyspira pilosicoli]WIH92302.1 DNA methylase [Brachyspira pilosicoli]WIH94594.1 DNA methylase [Brachyspira pilosicoli]
MKQKTIINQLETDKKLISILKKLPNNYWDFKNENTKEYTIHSYPAVMVPPISRNIINIVKQIMEVDSLFDPFSGSGTVLVEGMLANIKTVYGNDINPLAIFISKVKTDKLDIYELKKEVSVLLENINNDYKKNIDFYEGADEYCKKSLDITSKNGWGDNAPKYLREYIKLNKINFEVPDFKNIGYWFKPRVILQLQMIKNHILTIKKENIRNFVFVAFSELVRIVSNRRKGEFKMFRMLPAKVESFNPDVLKEFTYILENNIKKMHSFVEACKNNNNNSKVKIFNNNVIDLFCIPDSSIDLVITSPPYGDSRTTVAYGEYSRLSLQWLNLFELSQKEIMMLDKRLMGGVKFRNGFEFSIPSKTLNKSLNTIKNIDLERAGDVYSFYLDLEKAISLISNKTKKGGYQFWVVANRTVKGELLKTDKIITEIASKYNMDYVYTIDRNIINKVMPSLNSPTNVVGKKSETMCNEHIVILRKQ